MSKPGAYIVIEGLDGSGKTTQLNRLLEYLGDNSLGVREPGGTPMSEHIRTLLKDSSLPRAPATNAFLFSAARADLIENIIRPAIVSGTSVVSDRNWLSTVAYQTAEGLDVAPIMTLSRMATEEFFEPDLLLFIDTEVAVCQKRLDGRGLNQKADFFETKGRTYFEKIRQAYLQHVQQLPRTHVIDGNGSPDAVWQQVLRIIQSFGAT